MAVQWVGRFRELSDRHDDPSILDCVQKLSASERSAAAEYLRSGHGLIDVMEIRPDVIDGTALPETGSVLGDGAWIWREDLAHCVEKYRVALDPVFLGSTPRLVPHADKDALGNAWKRQSDCGSKGESGPTGSHGTRAGE